MLEKQRQHENTRLTGLEPAELRQFLTEAATCVVQSGNEVAKVTLLETRLKASHSPAAKLLQKSRQSTSLSDSRALNNLLASFYLKPASGEQGGSIEFVHKSFGEFLFAERLLEALADWTQRGGRRQASYTVPDNEMHRELYDLLGYGGLTPEIVGYLTPRLVDQLAHDSLITLFQRLNDFYDRWCDGEFIDADPPTLPQQTMRLLKEQGIATGQRQVDVYTGLNVMILCLELHRYGQSQAELKEAIVFYPSGQHSEEENDYTYRLLKVIHYSDAISLFTFTKNAGAFFTSANLAVANLNHANLVIADLTSANLTSASLYSAILASANLSHAYLVGTNLSHAYLHSAILVSANLHSANLGIASLVIANLAGAYLTSADLTNADLTNANLENITWDEKTKWDGVKGLETARDVPEALKRQLGLP